MFILDVEVSFSLVCTRRIDTKYFCMCHFYLCIFIEGVKPLILRDINEKCLLIPGILLLVVCVWECMCVPVHVYLSMCLPYFCIPCVSLFISSVFMYLVWIIPCRTFYRTGFAHRKFYHVPLYFVFMRPSWM